MLDEMRVVTPIAPLNAARTAQRTAAHRPYPIDRHSVFDSAQRSKRLFLTPAAERRDHQSQRTNKYQRQFRK
jgi:hypothetical protein